MHTRTLILYGLPYSGKVWRGECLANLFFSCIWRKKVRRIDRSAKGLLIVTTTLDGFSLANHEQFAKLSRYTVFDTDCLH